MARLFVSMFLLGLFGGNIYIHAAVAAPGMRGISIAADVCLWLFLLILGNLLNTK